MIPLLWHSNSRIFHTAKNINIKLKISVKGGYIIDKGFFLFMIPKFKESSDPFYFGIL
jgi:hypothetical protein